MQFTRSLSADERVDIYADVQEANPGVSAKELLSAHRAALLKAGLDAQEKKSRDEKNPSRSLSLSAGNKGGTDSSSSVKNKDASLPLLH